MTLAEYAQMINGEYWLKDSVQCELYWQGMKNYDHQKSYNLPIKPSPNLPNSQSIALYPSLCLFEGTDMSVGRGTSQQFQVIGSAKLDSCFYAFTPISGQAAKYPKHENKDCCGWDLRDIEVQNKVDLDYLLEAYRQYEDKDVEFKPYTTTTAVDHGWIWNTPLQSRIGSGLVFNKDITDVDEAKIHFCNFWNNRIKEDELKVKLKEQALKDEIRLEKQRTKEIKLFLRKEQALLRIEQAEKQKKFLQQLKLDKQIEKFRVREVKELEKLEKISLREKREDYAGLQQRIEKLKEKYRIIRDQKIRERVEALGVKIQGDEDRETLLQKEKEYTLARQKIEFALESFYRSASSLVFQLNKRHITRHMSIFRCIDRRFETGEIFVKWDEASDDEWLLLIYIKNNSPDEGIVIEDKTNPEKNISHEFKNNEIFKASDTMVDALTQLIARKRAKNIN